MNNNIIQNQHGFTLQEVESLKKLINPKGNIPDEQMAVFLHMCARTKLDPWLKHIYAVPRGGQLTVQTSIDGFRLIAERTGKYAPGKATDFTFDDKGQLISATAYVKKMTEDGTWHEISETAYLKEYTNGGSFWSRMPTVMLGKCAESRALRRAFPMDLSGLYTAEEIRDEQEEVVAVIEDKINDDQLRMLEAIVSGDFVLVEKIYIREKIKKLEDLPASRYEIVMKSIRATMEAKKC